MYKLLLRIFALFFMLPLLPAVVASIDVSAATPTLTSIFEARIYDDGEYALPYRIYVPEDYDPAKSYPLILFFHGSGERGNDNAAQLKNAVGQMFKDHDSPVYQCIVVAPQCPTGANWVNIPDWVDAQYSTDEIAESRPLATALKLLESLKGEYNVDSDRIYSTGLSMGGFATWDLLVRHTDLFAAAIPVCGGADYRYAERLIDVPIYTFHGLQDPTVPYIGTERMVTEILDAGGEKIHYVTYPDQQHLIWEQAFATEGLFEWLLSQRLSDRTAQLPPIESEESSSTSKNESTDTPDESTTPDADPDPTESVTESVEESASESMTESEPSANNAPTPTAIPWYAWLVPAVLIAGVSATIASVCTWLVMKRRMR